MNNAAAGKRPAWNTAHFVANTITSNVALDGIRKAWKETHNDTHAYVSTHLSAGLLVFASEIVEAGRDGVDLRLQREPQGLVVLLGDQTLFCGLLGLQLSQLHLLLTQSLLSCCCTALTGLQGALKLCLRGRKHKDHLIIKVDSLTSEIL